MDMIALKNLIRDAVHDDADIAAWCDDTYGKPCKVYVGADTREPPGAADCPLVHIFMGAKTGGMDAENLSHTFGIGVEIYDESFVEVEGKDNLVEVAGIERVERLRKLVETAVAAVIPSGTFLTVLEIEYEPVEFFPFFLAGMEITMEVPCFQGMDPFE